MSSLSSNFWACYEMLITTNIVSDNIIIIVQDYMDKYVIIFALIVTIIL